MYLFSKLHLELYLLWSSFAKIGNGFWPETIFAKNLHYWYFRGSEYASGSKYASGF